MLTDTGWDLVVTAAPGHVTAVRRCVIDGLTEHQIDVLREVACHVARKLVQGIRRFLHEIRNEN